MRTIGVRELKDNTSQVLRWVREHAEAVGITHRGRVIARLVPAEDAVAPVETGDPLFADMDSLAAEISASWPKGLGSTDAVRDLREKSR